MSQTQPTTSEASYNTSQSQVVSPGTKRKNDERRNISHVWQYMEKINEQKKIRCKVADCSKVYSDSTSTRVLRDHLTNDHKISKQTLEGSESEQESVTSPKNLRMTEQSRLTGLFLTFLINNIQSFVLSDDPDFKKFIFGLNNKYVLPCRKTVREKIKIRYDRCLEDVKDMVKTIRAIVHITTDIWTSISSEPYMSVTVHFVNNQWKLTSMLLDIFYFPHPHDSSFILENMNRVIFLKFIK